MGKNIIVLSDGTGQKGGDRYNTNVYKLFQLLEDRTDRQVVFYDPGLGTDWHRITGSIAGRGISKNILDCYRFIFQNFEADDQIYLFGFSRGAATVRSLSGFLHLFGILPKCREDLIEEAFRIYRIGNDKKRIKKAGELVERNSTMWCKIKFLGVWDTVAALGLPFKWLSYFLDHLFPHRFHNFRLSDSVSCARHALSIDDERKTFHPTLWERLENPQPGDRLKQVWFSGVHTDVGGGYKEEELSNISLCWMIEEATAKGLRLYKGSKHYQQFKACTADPDGLMHNEQIGFPGKWYRRLTRTWNPETHGELFIHGSVLMRTRNAMNAKEPAYAPWASKSGVYTVEPWVSRFEAPAASGS